MARKSQFKNSGGYLNDVNLTITGYRFTDEIPSAEGPVAYVPGKWKNPDTGKLEEKPHRLNVVLSFRVDDATEDSTQFLSAGNYDNWDVSEDGQTLTPLRDGVGIATSSKWAIFVASYEAVSGNGGQADETDVEGLEENQVNYAPLVGQRVRVAQRVNEELTKKFGQRVAKKGSSKGKAFDRTDLVVDEYLGFAGAPATPATKANGAVKTVPKQTTTPAAKSSGKVATKAAAAAPESVDVSNLAAEATLHAVRTAGKVVDGVATLKGKNKLSMPLMLFPAVKASGLRDEVRAFVFDDENLNAIVSSVGGDYDPAEEVIRVPVE